MREAVDQLIAQYTQKDRRALLRQRRAVAGQN